MVSFSKISQHWITNFEGMFTALTYYGTSTKRWGFFEPFKKIPQSLME